METRSFISVSHSRVWSRSSASCWRVKRERYGWSETSLSFWQKKRFWGVNEWRQFPAAVGSGFVPAPAQTRLSFLIYPSLPPSPSISLHLSLFLCCCSYTPVLSSGSLFYSWWEFNSPFSLLPLRWSGLGLWFTINSHIHFIFVSVKEADKIQSGVSDAAKGTTPAPVSLPRHGQIVWKWKTWLRLFNYLFESWNKV